MNKEKQQVYNEVLAEVLDRFGLTEERMFRCNCAECVEARTSLVMTLSRLKFSDSDIAELTQKMRRQRTGIPETAEPNISNKVVMCSIVAAMSYMENGVPAVMEDIYKGWELL